MKCYHASVLQFLTLLILWSIFPTAQAAIIVDGFTTGAVVQQSASGIDLRQDLLPDVLGSSRRIYVGPADPNGPPDAQTVAISTEPPGTFTLATQLGAQGVALFYGRAERLNLDLTNPALSVIEIDFLTVTSPPVLPLRVTLTNEDPVGQALASVVLRASDIPYTERLPVSSFSALPTSAGFDPAAVDWIGFGVTPSAGFSMQIDEIRIVPEPSSPVFLLIPFAFLAGRGRSPCRRRFYLSK